MRTIFVFIMTTLDGDYEGLNQEFGFWVVDEEFNEFAVEQWTRSTRSYSGGSRTRGWPRTGRRPRRCRMTHGSRRE